MAHISKKVLSSSIVPVNLKLFRWAILSLSLLLATFVSTYSQSSLDSLKHGFAHPPISARPKALWPWVNGNFSLPAITREMEEAKAKGMGGFDIWDVGVQINPDHIIPNGPPFLGDESLNAITHAIREGNRLGLELGLITSSSWNAGGSWVKPEHGAMGLFRSDTVINGPIVLALPLPFPEIAKEYNGRKTLVQYDSSGLPLFYKDVATLAHRLSRDSLVKSSDVKIIDTTRGTVSLPAGRWRVVRYVCAPTGQPLMIPSGNSDGLMLDHFSAEAQEANMAFIIGRLKTKFSTLRGLSLKYLYEDSYEVNTAVWTPSLPSYFEKTKQYSIIPFLPVLDGFIIDNKQYSNRFTFDFKKVLSNLIIENHYAKGTEIARREGIGFHAEAGGPGEPIHNVPFEDLRALGALTVPRGEFWNKHPQLELLQIVKGISSASHIYNQRYVEAEAFTSVWLWQEGPDQLKALADRAMCEGLNRFVYHTFPHTTPEAGKPGWIYNFGTIINTTNGWWDKSKSFHEYLSRCSYLLQQGNFVGDVAFYYGDHAPNFVPPKHIPTTLGPGYDYDVINTEVLLSKLSVRDGKIFLPHGQSYEVLVLPDNIRMDPAVLRRIEELLDAGAVIIGKKPQRAYSLSKQEVNDRDIRELSSRTWRNSAGKERSVNKGKIIYGKTVRQALSDRNIVPDVIFTAAGTHDSCDYIHRATKDAEVYFIRNKSRKPFKGKVTFRVSGLSGAWWNPVTGNIHPVSEFNGDLKTTTMPLTLNGHESAFIVFSKGDKPNVIVEANLYNSSNGTMSEKDAQEEIVVDNSWKLSLQHGAGIPTEIKLNSLLSWHQNDNETVRHFSGAGTYSTNFEISTEQIKTFKHVLLELNDVREIADVYLNGALVGTSWFRGQQHYVSKFVQEGRNELIIDVINSINNALIGDAKRPAEYRQFRSNITKLSNAWMTPFAEARLIPAGLIGPVKLILRK